MSCVNGCTKPQFHITFYRLLSFSSPFYCPPTHWKTGRICNGDPEARSPIQGRHLGGLEPASSAREVQSPGSTPGTGLSRRLRGCLGTTGGPRVQFSRICTQFFFPATLKTPQNVRSKQLGSVSWSERSYPCPRQDFLPAEHPPGVEGERSTERPAIRRTVTKLVKP